MTNSAMPAEFIETHQYRRFGEFCDACRRYQYIGLCYGPPGVGKTLSARRYANWDVIERYHSQAPNGAITLEEVKDSAVILYTPPVVVTSPGRLPNDIHRLREMLRGFIVEAIRRQELPRLLAARQKVDELYAPLRDGRNNVYSEPPDEVERRLATYNHAHEAMTARMRAQLDPTALIIIDEADRLKMTGLEQMRAIFDRGGISMVLIGMPGMEKKLARFPQLYSRIGFVHEFRPLSAVEVRELLREKGWAQAILHDSGIGDDETLAAIIRITGGNFRLLHRLLSQIARVLQINQLNQVTAPVVEAARESLVIGTA